MSNKKRFYISTLIVAGASLLSRILGLLRSSLLASFYGATDSQGLADCYQASFILPDIIYNLVVLGAVSIVLIPYFSVSITKNDNDELDSRCSSLINFFFILIFTFSLLSWVFAPFFVKNILVSGWTDLFKIETTIRLTRIMLIQPIFMSLSGIFAAYINSKEKFTSYSIAMLSYNLGIIGGILFLSKPFGIDGVAWGTVIGSALQFSIQAIGVFKSGFKYKFHLPVFNREFGELFVIAIPRIIAIGSEQFIRFFFTYLGSFIFTGSIIIFSYAENFSMVPFGMIAVSVSTTAFPVYSKLYVSEEYEKMFSYLFDTIRMVLFYLLPITILMMILRFEIIDILLGYNKFNSQDVLITAKALTTYLIGIPFYSVTILLAKYFYAQKKTFEPMVISIIISLFTAFLAYYLVKIRSTSLDVNGLTISRSIGFILQTIFLLLILIVEGKRKNYFSNFPLKEAGAIAKIIGVNGILFFFLYLLNQVIPKIFSGKMQSLFSCTILGFACIIIYVFLSYFTKVQELEVFTEKFRRK